MSTHFPPSQPDGAPHGPSASAPRVSFETPRTGTSSSVNPPISRGERRGWNTATGIIGGLGALTLLLGGAGAATAAVMTQERSGTWTASSDASSIVVDTDGANVNVVTSPTAEHVEIRWQAIGWGLGDQQIPRESDGEIRLDAPEPTSRWNGGISNIRITVPEDSSDTSLDLTAQHGLVHVSGSFDRVSAHSSLGSVSANALKANSLDARTTSGQVLLDGVEVSDRLDAHTRNGFTSVNVAGAAPRQTAVTAESGVYELAMPTDDYWYPANSQQSFADPRSPETVLPDRNLPGDSFDSRWDGDAAASLSVGPSPSPSGSPDASGDGTPGASAGASGSASPGEGVTRQPGGAPSNSARDDAGIVTAWSAEKACASAPEDRPCLMVAGEPVSAQDSADMRYWREEWNSTYNDALTEDPWGRVID